MDFSTYQALFDRILEREIITSPYADVAFYEYVKLNKSRMNRWLKNGDINASLRAIISSWNKPTKWLLITEPWCGDAAHSVPFIYLLSTLNPNIALTLQLRDSDGSEIDRYLTNNARSIPKLIIRDSFGNDLLIWGPRPKKCEDYNANLLAQNTDLPIRKAALQQWYNQDKGAEIQAELLEKLREINL